MVKHTQATIITKSSILDVAAVLDPPLTVVAGWKHTFLGDISHGIWRCFVGCDVLHDLIPFA